MKFFTRLGNLLRFVLPVDNAAPVVVALFVFVVLFAIALALSRRSWGALPVVEFSSGAAIIRGSAPVLGIAYDVPSGRGGDAWRTNLILVGRSRYRGVDYPNSYMVGEQYVTGFGGFDVGLGLAYLANPAPFNGAHLNFNLSLGYRFSRLTVGYRHFSCAGSCRPNLGRDVLYAGWRF